MVVGAQDYHEGRNQDPASVGVQALDKLTLEVKLVNPVAYFPYVMYTDISFPLPRQPIERFGDDWWRPEHIISNGAFRLAELDPETGFILDRNPDYHGEFLGNIQRIEMILLDNQTERNHAYLENRVDFTFSREAISTEMSPAEKYAVRNLSVRFLLINPLFQPLDDVRVRRALSLALDRSKQFKELSFRPAYGGIIPPGMAGHSPDIGLSYDPETARRLLAEAGYPNGQGFPVLKGSVPYNIEAYASEILSQFQIELGIEAEVDIRNRPMSLFQNYSFALLSWIANYPDPDNFLRQSNINYCLKKAGWQDVELDDLLETAAGFTDRSQRLALYRRADHLFVTERVLVIPTNYEDSGLIYLAKPWVKNFKFNLLGHFRYSKIIIADH